jgi:hypothetical protein
VTGHAPAVVLDSTVWVTPVVAAWTVRNDTPASAPSRITASPVGCSQNPNPWRIDSDGTSLLGRTMSANRSSGTIRPAYRADHSAWMSAAVE